MARRLLVVVALLSALVSLGACQARPAAAAFVGDTRISMHTVDQLFARVAADPVSRDLVAEYPGETRLAIVQTLVRIELLRRLAEAEGIEVSAARIAEVREAAKAEREHLNPFDKLLPVEQFAVHHTYVQALLQRVSAGATSEDEVSRRAVALVERTAARHRVEVNPRFGSFDPARFALVPAKEAAVRPLPTGDPAAGSPR